MDLGWRRPVLEQWGEGLLHALHRAGVERVERFGFQKIGERRGLLVAAEGNVHIHAAAEDVLITRFDFGVTD